MRYPIIAGAVLLAASSFVIAAPASAPASCPGVMAQQGDMSKAQFNEMTGQHFEQMDADHNGVVTVAERDAWRKQMKAQCPRKGGGKRGASGPMGDGPMAANKDISKADFMQRAEQHFTQMDTNHDGVISVAEKQARRDAMREQRGKGPRASAPPAVK